ncbi:MAG: hypothetical protein GWP12_02920 [Nitrospirae bacterium]|nr:hypothetical protein [Nitrospirota bacterium]
MKRIKSLPVIILALLAVVVVSCKKEAANEDLTKQVTGTYEGTLTTNGVKSTSQATADITKYNDYTIQVHCYGDDIDTTFMLELYEDGNMMRVCFTDDDFYNEYGHHKSNDHHMMGDNGNWTNWSQHMSNEHGQNDQHYGYFNMNDHQFDYTFVISNNSGSYTQQFVGTLK